MMEMIMETIIRSKSLNNYINYHFRNRDINLKNDFKQEFYLVIIEYDIKELENIYIKGDIEKFCMGILNKMIKNSHPFYNKYIGRGFWDINLIKYVSDIDESEYINIENEDIMDRLEKEIIEDTRIQKIEKLLLHIEPTSSLLFKLKYFKGLSYNDIAKLSGVSYQVVRNKVRLVVQIIKNRNI